MGSFASWLRCGHWALAALALALAALVAALALGVLRVESSARRISETAAEHNRRIAAVAALFLANGRRSGLIEQLFAAEEPEARRALYAEYRRASEAQASTLEALSALRLGEHDAPARQRVLAAAARALALGDEVAALLAEGDIGQASELNLTQAVLAEGRLQEALYGMLLAGQAESTRGLVAAGRELDGGLALAGAAGLAALIAGALLAAAGRRASARTRAALEREKELAETALHSIVDGVVTTDSAGRVEFMNPAAERHLGWRLEEARGRPLAEVYRVIEERSGEPLDPLGAGAASEREGGPVAVRLVDRHGRECPIRHAQAPIRGRDGTEHGRIVVFHDVSQLRAMAQQLTWQASHDALTGLVNRREFERRLGELLETARAQGREHALLYLDLDNFKAVNDTCGHAAGDELLRQLTAVMQTCMRGSDTLARLGGDEFGALLDSCPLDQALRIANALRETIREFRFVWRDKTFSVGVSIGLVPLTASTGDGQRALTLADVCCYEAKSRGRDRVQVYRPEDRDFGGLHGDLRVVSQINRAFELGQFRLYRQFIMPLVPGPERPPHHEVLVRMLDRSGNLIPPTGFMPAAERYNLLTSIERWVVSALVEYLHRQWTSGGIPREPRGGGQRGYYSVNISGASINDKSFPDFLRNLLTRYELPPGLLCFEITETTAISNLTKAAELMHELKGMGCCFALDDFGTGMSSFAYLKYLPVDHLKIAGMFTRDMAHDPMDHAIAEAINRIGHILGMQTVAESVEDAATLARLRELGVDYAQGYFISEPEALATEPGHERAVLRA